MYYKRLGEVLWLFMAENQLQKPSMLFSSNVTEDEANGLSSFMGIPRTPKLGMYLGQHIVTEGRDIERHKELLP